MKLKATLQDVFAAIESERTYQDNKWGNAFHTSNPNDTHSIEEWLVYIKVHLDKAFNQVSGCSIGSAEYLESLDIVRKITTLGVRCMEQNGAPLRG